MQNKKKIIIIIIETCSSLPLFSACNKCNVRYNFFFPIKKSLAITIVNLVLLTAHYFFTGVTGPSSQQRVSSNSQQAAVPTPPQKVAPYSHLNKIFCEQELKLQRDQVYTILTGKMYLYSSSSRWGHPLASLDHDV